MRCIVQHHIILRFKLPLTCVHPTVFLVLVGSTWLRTSFYAIRATRQSQNVISDSYKEVCSHKLLLTAYVCDACLIFVVLCPQQVYHDFHDEVDNYRQHWWRCNGPCKSRPPYYGWVKRAMNRAPSARDFWWDDHVRSCGGTYTKVKEPDGYGVKKNGGKEQKKDETTKKHTSKDHKLAT